MTEYDTQTLPVAWRAVPGGLRFVERLVYDVPVDGVKNVFGGRKALILQQLYLDGVEEKQWCDVAMVTE